MRLIDADALLDKMQDYGEGQERLMLIDPYWVRKAPTIETKTKKCPICGSDLYEHCGMCCYEGEKVMKSDRETSKNS